jgi:hypothetical protein
MSINDLSRLVQPKSDQLNADDLLGGPITVTITIIDATGSNEQPISLSIDGGYKPYKPCKSMTRLMMFCWGKDGSAYVGRKLTLYNEPTVKWAGVEVGGIRISHMSDIAKNMAVSLTTTRGQRKPYTVKVLTLPPVTQAELDNMLPKMKAMIEKGDRTPTDIINNMQKKGVLSPAQKEQIITLGNVPAIEENEEEDL